MFSWFGGTDARYRLVSPHNLQERHSRGSTRTQSIPDICQHGSVSSTQAPWRLTTVPACCCGLPFTVIPDFLPTRPTCLLNLHIRPGSICRNDDRTATVRRFAFRGWNTRVRFTVSNDTDVITVLCLV